MKRIYLSTALFLNFSNTSFSQQPDEILNQWSSNHAIEKAYLHFDRDNYTAGETAWFKAYLYSEYQPDTISTSFYAELLNSSSLIISRKIFPILAGRTTGQFELPDTLSTGNYMVRAYTPTMLNLAPGQDSAFIFQRNIFVFGKRKIAEDILPKQKTGRLEFFPESGNFITGQMNTIAFKATDEKGLPVSVTASVKNSKNETVTGFSSYHDGMGMFDLTPGKGEKYFALIDDDSAMRQYYLPAHSPTGIVFRIIPSGKNKFFEILQLANDSLFRAAYMIGQMQHHIVFRKDFPSGQASITGTLDVSHLASGIMQVTVFNKFNMPLAERLCFVDNDEYRLQAELKTDTLSFTERGKNVFHLALKDTVVGSFSLSVTDADYGLYPLREQNILSTLLFTSDIHGYVHNPAYYFNAKNDSTETALDLVMMTNGWRRFKWTELIKNAAPVVKYKDPGYIQVSGRINLQNTKKFHVSKPFLVFITSPDSSRVMRMGITDANGYFHLDSLLFFGASGMLFKDIRGKKSDLFDVKLNGDTLTRLFPDLPYNRQQLLAGLRTAKEKETKIGYDFDAFAKTEGITLVGVTVKARKKTDIELLEEKYASGLFSGFSAHTIDLVNTNEEIVQSNIFDYLSGRVPGLNISSNGPDYDIYYRQSATASSMGLIPMIIYLDEILTDASFVSVIPANQVAMVKVYSNFIGAEGNAAGGALAIYTKKGADIYNSVSSGDRIRYQGYSVIKEFYSPDYSADTSPGLKTDNRVTLLWKPDINLRGINPQLPVKFYNNDRTKRFKLVAEGMTADGRLLMFEKIILPRGFNN
jgi:hypothetical protein